MSDGSVFYKLYDSLYGFDCSMEKNNDNKYCCYPDKDVFYSWECNSNEGCFVLFANENYRQTNLIRWEGSIDSENKPCFDYELNGRALTMELSTVP